MPRYFFDGTHFFDGTNWYVLAFRQEPVPHTGRLKNPGRVRTLHTQNERRQCAAPDMAQFTRAKRNHLPTAWDAPFTHWEKSWKHQKKCRHQWEKRLKSA